MPEEKPEFSADVIVSPIARGFEAWFPPVAERAEAAIAEGLVVIDTNVLLNLYKFDADVTKQWFDIFDKLGDRLWIPHQVLTEYWKNRDRLAGHPEHTLKAASGMAKARRSLVDTYEAWIREQGLTPTPAQKESIAAINEAVERVSSEIGAAERAHRERFDSDPSRDEVARGLARLSERKNSPIGVGSPFEPEELARQFEIADQRYASSIPPGYMDDANNEKTNVGKDSDAKYGDYLLWRQTLDETKARGQAGASPAWVVFITDDGKEDWWRKFVADDQEHRRVARPELVDEMLVETGAHYIQLTAASFLRHAKALDIQISDDAIRSAEAVSKRVDGEWLPEILHMDVPRSDVRAHAQLNRSDERVKVLRGSQARREQTPTIPGSTERLIEQLLGDGVLVDDPENPAAYLFTADWIARTVSAAACVVRASSINGHVAWRTEDGLSPVQVRRAHQGEDMEMSTEGDEEE